MAKSEPRATTPSMSWPWTHRRDAPTRGAVAGEPAASSVEDARVLLVHPTPDVAAALAVAPVAAAVLDAGARAPLGLAVSPAGRDALSAVDLPLKLLRVADPARPPERAPTGWDIVADLTPTGPSSARAWADAVPAPTRLGFAAPRRRPRGLEVAAAPDPDGHAAEALLGPLAPLGIRRPRYAVDPRISDAARARAAARWDGADRHLLVWLGPWAAAHPGPFLRAGLEIAELDPDAAVVVAGPAASKAAATALARTLGARTTAPKAASAVAALFAEADLVVADDDDPLQLALLFGRPAVAVFAAKDPVRWGPPRPADHHRVLRPSPGAGADPAYARLVARHAVELWRPACAR